MIDPSTDLASDGTRPEPGPGPDGLTNKQLTGLYRPVGKREPPLVLSLAGRPILGALVALLAVVLYLLLGR